LPARPASNDGTTLTCNYSLVNSSTLLFYPFAFASGIRLIDHAHVVRSFEPRPTGRPVSTFSEQPTPPKRSPRHFQPSRTFRHCAGQPSAAGRFPRFGMFTLPLRPPPPPFLQRTT
jgi:hypothetical protein